jgi:uncharacterized protein (DUF1499 family)
MRRAAVVSAAALATLVAAGFGLRLYMGGPAQDRLRPGEAVAIAELRGKLPANAALACPPGYCQADGALASPVFAVDADRLYRDIERIALAEPGVVPIAVDPAGRRFVAAAHSAVFRFPDIVTAEIVELGRHRSSLALYSRARYGKADFGVNRGRVERWLSRLKRLAAIQ